MGYDVIVVGAGPAGASAAYWLGQAGRRLLVLEKEALPRYKACGGGVPKSVLDRFPFSLSSVVEQWIRRVRFRFRDGREIEADIPDRSVAMVMRDRFDLHILNHAQAEVHDRSPVTMVRQDEDGVEVSTASGEDFRARYLIGADGANSRVARLVGLRRERWKGGAIEAEVPVGDELLETYRNTALFIFGTPPGGYLWVFPKTVNLSVGIGIVLGRADYPHMRRLLRREMSRLGIEVDATRPQGHPLPIYLQREPLRQGRVLLAGDAARLVDPLLGEGIRHAVDSGRIAAESVLTGNLQRYTERVDREIGRDLLWGQRWARLFYKYPRRSFELGVRNPRIIKEFLHLFAGTTSYRRMATRALPDLLLGLGQRTEAKRRTYTDQ
ncbi:MAG: geranylgeranyl reductase family protein [Chloroflexota bacterium]|nr:geranylgeranyl reductase family protein [Chloroflexota bacterium]